MVEVTTECPNCHELYTRDVYEEGLIAGLILDICDSCQKDMTNEHGDFLIQFS